MEIIDSLKTVSESAWNALVSPHDPFTDIRFLRALEESGSIGVEAGWSSCHILVYRDSELIAAMPLYAKDHSYGEYIFDWDWANSSHRAGIPYYPKLVSAVPFTPASSNRILTGNAEKTPEILDAIHAGLMRVSEDLEAMSIHLLFCTEEERDTLVERFGYLKRLTYQFHWQNQGWKSFEDYLSTLRAPSRKQVRRERRKALESSLCIEVKRGNELNEIEWNSLYPLYRSTTDAKGAIPYLTPAFFDSIQASFAEHLVVVLASRDGIPVAGSISFQKGNHLYGRYWGSQEPNEYLHFELCYYQLIELAIAQGYTRFEAGAQGSHKLKRGLLPSPTYSAHWLRHKGLSKAVAAYLPQEAESTKAEMGHFLQKTPFKRESEEAKKRGSESARKRES